MATYDTALSGSPQFQGHSDVRLDRGLRVSWTGIFAGTALGWGLFSLLALLGAAVGFANIDPYSAHPASGLGVGSGIFGGIALLVTSFFGAWIAVRIAGNRRRNEALLHGGVCWALSMLVGAMLAMGAARTAAEGAAVVASGSRAQAKMQREANVRSNNGGPTAADRDRANDAASTAAQTSGAGAGGAFLALIASLLGALAASRKGTGVHGLGDAFRLGRKRDDADSMKSPAARESTSIVPPI